MKTTLDNQTKQLLQEVAVITGANLNLVNSVLENLLIAWLLKILRDSSDKKFTSVPIPYIGSIGIKYRGEQIDQETSEVTADADFFLSVNDSFKKLVRDIFEDKTSSLADIVKAKIIKDTSKK